MSRRHDHRVAMAYVYDGRRCLGFIPARGKLGFEAIDHDQNSLGIFTSQRAAATAVMNSNTQKK
jgi:hypothetical protein